MVNWHLYTILALIGLIVITGLWWNGPTHKRRRNSKHKASNP